MQDLVGFTFGKHSIYQIYFSSPRHLYRFSGRFSQPEDVLLLSFNQTLRRTSYLHLLYHASRARKPNPSQPPSPPVLSINLWRRGGGKNEVSSGRKYWRLHFLAAGKAPSLSGIHTSQQKTFLPQIKLTGHPHFMIESSSSSNLSSSSSFSFPKSF